MCCLYAARVAGEHCVDRGCSSAPPWRCGSWPTCSGRGTAGPRLPVGALAGGRALPDRPGTGLAGTGALSRPAPGNPALVPACSSTSSSSAARSCSSARCGAGRGGRESAHGSAFVRRLPRHRRAAGRPGGVAAAAQQRQAATRPAAIAAAFATWTAADNGYALHSARGEYDMGTAVNAAYVLGPVLLAPRP